MKKIGIAAGLVIMLIGLYYLYAMKHQPKFLRLYGNVDIRDVNLGFRVGGRLMEVKVDEGDEVKAGELLATLDDEPYLREVNAAKAQVGEQEALLSYAQTVFTRETKLNGTGASSPDKYQNAKAALGQAQAALEKAKADLSQMELRLADTKLYSPSNGMILTRALEPGTMVAANATVLSLSLVNPVWVRAYISEVHLSKAKQGTKVLVHTDSNPTKSYPGVIGFVSPIAEFTPKTVETPDLRTELVYRLRIVMQDPEGDLRQGMPVTVELH